MVVYQLKQTALDYLGHVGCWSDKKYHFNDRYLQHMTSDWGSYQSEKQLNSLTVI